MMPSDLPQFAIRIDPSLLAKLRYVAKYHAHSANHEVGMLIKRHVERFEQMRGEIEL